MGKQNNLSTETITKTISVHKLGYVTKEITEATGVCARSLKIWQHRLCAGGMLIADTPCPEDTSRETQENDSTYADKGHR